VKQIIPILLILIGFCGTVRAQPPQDSLSDFTFSYFVNGVPLPMPTGPYGFIQFPDTNAGKSSTITFLAGNNGAQQAYTLTNATVTGPGFSLLSTQTAVPIGGTGSLRITFSPTTANPQQTTGALNFQLVAGTGLTFNVYITLFANVLQPNLILTYIDPVSGNQSPLSPGGILQFPKTTVKATAVAQVVVLNKGNGDGTVDSVAVSGTGFTLTNAPLTPATIAAGGTFAVGITFSPVAIQEYKGTATISVGGVSTTVNLDGQGTNSTYTYTQLSVVGNTALQPNGTISLPDTPAYGVSKSSVTIQIQNTGNQPGPFRRFWRLARTFNWLTFLFYRKYWPQAISPFSTWCFSRPKRGLPQVDCRLATIFST
jgi:hypothetical protein